MTPPELHTGIPTSKPAFAPLSMMTALDQASPVDPIMRAAVDFRLYVDWRPTSFSRRAAVSWASESSATLAVRRSFSFLSSDNVSDEAPALPIALPIALNGAATAPPSMRTGDVIVIAAPRREWIMPVSPSRR